jgi:hypothetical protein
MGFIMGADLQTPAKPGVKGAFIPVFAAVHPGSVARTAENK